MNSKETRPLRILIAEDNADCRVTLQRLLEMCGHQVEEAADGAQAVGKAASWQPEVGIIDIGLPHLDGFQVAQQLRSLFGDRLFLIAHTGYGSPADIQRGREAGFDAYLVKPLDISELHHWLGKARPGSAPPGNGHYRASDGATGAGNAALAG
jgi:CheY-like chemotaxis protein